MFFLSFDPLSCRRSRKCAHPYSALSRSNFLLVTFCRLLAFVFILALANLGTSFASAILAKDTTTSNGQLVDKNTNEVVATASAVNDYAVGTDDGDNARALQGNSNACTGGDEDTTNGDVCDTSTSSADTMTKDKALAMLKDCLDGKNVNLRFTIGGNVAKIMSICGSCGTSEFPTNQGQGNSQVPTSGKLCIQNSSNRLIVEEESPNSNAYKVFEVSAPGVRQVSLQCPADVGQANLYTCPKEAPAPGSTCVSNCNYYSTVCGCTVVTSIAECDTNTNTTMTMLIDYLECENPWWYGVECLDNDDCNTNTGEIVTSQYFYCVNNMCMASTGTEQ
jgi:hypothetical protein